MTIYQFYTAQKYISHCYEIRKASNSAFSIRAWAKKIGLKSHTTLSGVVNQEIKTPISLHRPLSLELKLNSVEAFYFLLLINIENTTDQYSRLMLLEQLEVLRKYKKFKMTEFADFSLLSDPFWGMLVEMTALKDFQNDPSWIRKKARISKSNQEIQKIIEILLGQGVLSLQNEKLTKNQEHITNVHDFANIGSQKYHKNCSLLAAQQVELQAVSEREFNGYALNIRKSDLPKIKTMIRSFIKDLILEYEAKPNEGDSTYQLNIQLFDLLKEIS
ncbi:MAG: TIGR02147 family protein [Pseudobdellovibrionaceae bacterium]